MALSADELAQLHTLFQGADWANLTDEQRFEKLHEPTAVANPNPQQQVPKPFLVSDILGCVSTSMSKVVALASLPTIRDSIEANDRTACALWNNALLGGGDITQAEHDAIAAVLTATEADPTWTATVPGPTPKQTLFGETWWTTTDGSVVPYSTNQVPLSDVVAAR